MYASLFLLFIFYGNNRFQKNSESKLNREQMNCGALMNLYFHPALLYRQRYSVVSLSSDECTYFESRLEERPGCKCGEGPHVKGPM